MADFVQIKVLGNAGAVVDGPAGTPSSQAITVQGNSGGTALPVTANAGTNLNTSALALDASIGTDGAAPPSIPGTGVRGWLRSAYDQLVLLVAKIPAALDMNSGNKSASTLRVTIATDQVQLTNKLLVTPDSVALPSHQSVNVDQLNGTTIDTNSGNKSAGTLRVVLATDQPTNTNKLAVTATTDQTTHGTTDLVADDIIKWAGTTLSAPVATAPDGTQTAPVIRALNRKFTTIETTTPLAGAATFTGAWHDSCLSGESYVVATSLSNIIGANFFIEESDDTGNNSFTRTVATWNGAPAANVLSYMVGVIRTRWWRVRYVNGATLQTTFELTTCAQTTCPDSVITNNTSGANVIQAKQVQCVMPGGGGGMTDNLALFMSWTAQNAAGQGPQDCLIRFHGGKWSGTAAATKSGASGARTPTAFHQASASASGDTTLWTPLTGNKFRVLRFKIQFTADAATSGGARITVLLRDATTDIGLGHIVFVPSAGATALNAAYDSGWIDLGQFGYQSTAANAVLNINLSAALSAGLCNVIVAGTEE